MTTYSFPKSFVMNYAACADFIPFFDGLGRLKHVPVMSKESWVQDCVFQLLGIAPR